jgi:protein AroM
VNKRKLVGIVTTGEAPREDVVPDIRRVVGTNVDILECGVLDGLSVSEKKELAPIRGEYTLMGRLKDGTYIELSRDKIVDRMQQCIDSLLRQEVDMIVILCFGTWPRFTSDKFLLEPYEPFYGFVLGLLREGDTLGVIVPSKNQTEDFKEQWTKSGVTTLVVSASPYSPTANDEVAYAAVSLKEAEADVVAMVCPGYTEEMKNIVQLTVGKPVILGRSVIASMLREVL